MALGLARGGPSRLGRTQRPPTVHRRAALCGATLMALGLTAGRRCNGWSTDTEESDQRAWSCPGPTTGWAGSPSDERISRTSESSQRCLRYSCLPRALVDAAAPFRPKDAIADHRRGPSPRGPPRRREPLDRGSASEREGAPAPAPAEAGPAAWSLPEASSRVWSALVGPPAALAQPRAEETDGRRLTTPDVWFDDVAMAVMVHSREFHAGVIDWRPPSTGLRPVRLPRGGHRGHAAPSPATRTGCYVVSSASSRQRGRASGRCRGDSAGGADRPGPRYASSGPS